MLNQRYYSHRILVADAVQHTRNLVGEVLRGAGHTNILHARDGNDLLEMTLEYAPRIVITTSRLPGLSGLEFARLVRAGHGSIPRQLSIIAMTDTPTKAFLDAARDSGVDEMLVRPFTAMAVIDRLNSVLIRPREFIDSADYVGPCRRRRMIEEYDGPLRRFVDPVDELDPGAPAWESGPNRAVVRMCVQRISELFKLLTDGDRRKLREIYAAVKETETIADHLRDAALAAAARSLGRYITAVGATAALDREIVTTHIDAMHTLGVLGSTHHAERQSLIDGLERVVDKKLGRRRAA